MIEPLRGSAEALYVCLDPFVITNAARINALALAARLPVMHGTRTNVEAGGLISYGPDFAGMSRRAAEIVDKVLRARSPPIFRSSSRPNSISSSISRPLRR